ncbi:hypothetical protein F0562_032982 [Nyssa sinensis]|uniref:Uncharacterized protein n=1 Tax=Nyssa sinensis TaxID=561372 RepID=A0A5J5AV77_9ASTE|nr:hypothetical protein F0562_032982 [Nyssa sinensis]
MKLLNSLWSQLDAGSYDALIEASILSQDFLFREMKEARIPELKGSYLTIMTGLTENQWPELMVVFLLVRFLKLKWNSGSFSLDHVSPFNIVAEDIFVLLGCSNTSPVFDPNEDLCDTGSGSGSLVCRGLYSCKGVTGIGLEPNTPISISCVYDPPIVLGSGYGLDLPKLQCSSYTSKYGYGGNEGNEMAVRDFFAIQ